MTKFVKNLNDYLCVMKIRASYLSEITGIDEKKMVKILSGTEEESESDREKIANAIGNDVEFFSSDTISISLTDSLPAHNQIFCTHEPSEKQKKMIEQLMDLVENIDEVLSAKRRFDNMAKEC